MKTPIYKTHEEACAVTIRYLIDQPELLKTAKGKKLWKDAVAIVKGTKWEDVLFPKPQTDKDRKFLKDLYFDLDTALLLEGIETSD